MEATESSVPLNSIPQGGHTARGGAPLTATFLFIGLSMMVPALLVRWTELDGDSLNVFLSFGIVVYTSLQLARVCYSDPGAIVRAGFYIFCYVFMGIAVLAQVFVGRFPPDLPGAGGFSPATITTALLAVWTGIGAFECGYYWHRLRRGKSTNIRVDHRRRGRVLSENRALLLGTVGLIFTVVLVARTGIVPFFESREEAKRAIQGVSSGPVYLARHQAVGGALTALAQVPSLIALFSVLYLKRHGLWRPGSLFREFLAHALTIGLIAANLVVNNPVANSRFWFGMVAITLLSILIPLNRATGVRLAVVFSVLCLLFAFTSLQAFRRSGPPELYASGPRADLVTTGTYSAFTMEMVGLRWLDTEVHVGGRQLLGAVLIFIPRRYWESKPVDTGNVVLPYVNPAASLWTEGQVAAGFPGIVGLFGALGLACSVFDRKLRDAPTGTAMHAAVPILGGFMIFVLRGSLSTVFLNAYPLALCLVLVTRRARSGEENRRR